MFSTTSARIRACLCAGQEPAQPRVLAPSSVIGVFLVFFICFILLPLFWFFVLSCLVCFGTRYCPSI